MTVKWRWWRFRFELDTFEEWRWRQPLGWGPRWLRRIWCFVFHWRQYDRIAGSSCNITPSPGPKGPWAATIRSPIPRRSPFRTWLYLREYQRTYGPGVQIYEHIRVLGCYQCQLPWSREYRYNSNPELEDP